jgi:futalosine hydrolase
VGLTAAAYSITRSVLLKKPTLILQAGIAGILNKELKLGSIAAVKNECIGDLGVEEDGRFRSIFELGLQEQDGFPWENGVLPNDTGLLEKSGLPLVNAVTVNEISTNKNRIQYYSSVSGADIESMEGAALHFVARAEKIPFLQVRSLSNFVGERNKSQWKMEEALGHLHETLPLLILKFLNT